MVWPTKNEQVEKVLQTAVETMSEMVKNLRKDAGQDEDVDGEVILGTMKEELMRHILYKFVDEYVFELGDIGDDSVYVTDKWDLAIDFIIYLQEVRDSHLADKRKEAP